MTRAIFLVSWTILFSLSSCIRVPSSWKDEQAFLPYYVVVDGLPSDQNVQTYYPATTSNDQVVQNDVVVKLFQRMNPHLQVLESEDGSKVVKTNEGLRTNQNQENEANTSKKKNFGKKHQQRYEINHKERPRNLIYPEERFNHRQYHNIEENKFKPDPHVVREGLQFYDAQKTQLQKQFPSRGASMERQDDGDSSESFNFEPYRTYAQVRKSFSKKRIPKKKKSDPRLKESIKDSKVHTVYSEEGYEDSGYDHGNQEKSAESREDLREKSADGNVETREYQKNDQEEFDSPRAPSPPIEEDFDDESSEEESETRIEENRNTTTENPTRSESRIVSSEKPENSEELILIDSYMDEAKHPEEIALKRSKRDTQKYPLYNYKKLNQLSSLRYIENSDNVPIESVEDSFYEKVDKIQCPEVTDVDPIPERIKKTDQNTTALNQTRMDAPKIKLNKLGDQIDCLKSRYFGEEPLDNPLFAEDKVETPKTIFKQDEEDNEVDYDERSGKILEDQNSTDEVLPEAEAYILRRLHRRPPQRYFEKNRRKRPKPIRKDLHPIPSNSERLSEVHYKDEIKPSEQMNVFSDIINNIKNSSRDLGVDSSEVQTISIRDNIFKGKNPKRERYNPKSGVVKMNLDPEVVEDMKDVRKVIRSTTARPLDFHNNPRYRKYKRRPVSSTPPPEIAIIKKRRKINQDLEDDSFKPMLDSELISNHKIAPQEIEPKTLNRYYVIGMQPPPEKLFIHPNLYRTSHVKKRKIQQPSRRRFIRSTRRGYAEIERGRQRTSSTTTEKIEDDDYEPHRRRNFHYDEKTGKIIYDKQPENEEIEEVEYEYVEVEEPTHPPPKSKQEPRRIWPSKFPDGPNYLEFVKKLKEDQTYVQILDPKPKEKEIETTTTPTTNKSEEPIGFPEYLAILGQVRNNKEYKFIEEPMQKSKNTTSSFEKERIEFEDEDVEDETVGEVQNSPGAQVLNYAEGDEVEDIDSDEKTKNYNPRTGVDISKYKSIERKPVTRHNISSKYSAEEEDDEINFKPSSTTSESITIDIPTTSIPSTIPLEINQQSSGTTPRKRILAGRRRGTTTIRATTPEITTASSITRSRVRSRFRSTTTERIVDQATRNRRNLQRTDQRNLAVPSNHKSRYHEVQGALKLEPTPRTITLDLIRQTEVENATTRDKPVLNMTKDVEVFKEYDDADKHGGNYKYRKLQVKVTRTSKPGVEEKDEKIEIKTDRYSDIIPKPFDYYYSDPKLPQKVNRLKVKNTEGLDEEIFEDQTQKAELEDVGDLFRDAKEHKAKSRSIEKRKDSVPAFIKDPSLRLYYYAPI